VLINDTVIQLEQLSKVFLTDEVETDARSAVRKTRGPYGSPFRWQTYRRKTSTCKRGQ